MRLLKKLEIDFQRYCSLALLAWLSIFFAGNMFAANKDSPTYDSIVRLDVFVSAYDYTNPWQRGPLKKVSGSGVIVQLPNHQFGILTNHHVINTQHYIYGLKNNTIKQYELKPIWRSHAFDLALLTLANENEYDEFYKNIEPMPLGELPPLQSKITLLGYPIGGQTLSITEGVLSRVEYSNYAHSDLPFLAGQVDAAMNRGNSGGPAVSDGKLVGLSFQKLNQANRQVSNIAYIIPAPIIRQFLNSYIANDSRGIPSLGLVVEKMKNKTLQSFYGADGEDGVLVCHVIPGTSADGIIKVDDVILKINDIPISYDASIQGVFSQRISMDYLEHSSSVGDVLRVQVLRDHKPMDLSVPLSSTVNQDLVIATNNIPPKYYTYQGLVFTTVTKQFVDAFKGRVPVPEVLPKILNSFRSGDQKEIVILLRVLPHEVTYGYHDLAMETIDSVNSVKVHDLEHLIELIEGSDKDYIQIEFGYKGLYKMILNHHDAERVNRDILQQYNIPFDRSEDLRDSNPAIFAIPNVTRQNLPTYSVNWQKRQRAARTEVSCG